MRELTQKETDNAPSWATHYDAVGDSVMFESKDNTQMMIKGQLGNLIPFGPVSEDSQPIPSKGFDISEYHRNESNESFFVDGDLITLVRRDNYTNPYFELTMKDAIALAKHFKLTAEDLK
jgi:hypothetical protein